MKAINLAIGPPPGASIFWAYNPMANPNGMDNTRVRDRMAVSSDLLSIVSTRIELRKMPGQVLILL